MIVGTQVVQRIIAMLPPGVVKTTYILGSQQPRQASYTAVPWGYGRKYNKSTREQRELMLAGALIGEEWHLFELYKTTETVEPKIGDQLTDDEAVVWQIKEVDTKMMNTIFTCLCLKNK